MRITRRSDFAIGRSGPTFANGRRTWGTQQIIRLKEREVFRLELAPATLSRRILLRVLAQDDVGIKLRDDVGIELRDDVGIELKMTWV